MQSSGKKILSIFSVVLLILAVMGMYSLITGKFQLCIFRIFTGFPCPGCGLTRALIALLKGKWQISLQYHPLLLPVLFTLLTAFAAHTAEKFPRLKLLHFFTALNTSKYFYPVIFAIIMVLYLYRMFTLFPGGPDPMTYDFSSIAGKLYTIFFSGK